MVQRQGSRRGSAFEAQWFFLAGREKAENGTNFGREWVFGTFFILFVKSEILNRKYIDFYE